MEKGGDAVCGGQAFAMPVQHQASAEQGVHAVLLVPLYPLPQKQRPAHAHQIELHSAKELQLSCRGAKVGSRVALGMAT